MRKVCTYLFIQSSGTKLWRFDYRFFGKRKTLALDAFPEVTHSSTRDKPEAACNYWLMTPPMRDEEGCKSF